MTKLAVDGDILVYSCGFAAQKNIHTVWLGNKKYGEFEYKKDMMQAIGGEDAPFTFTTEVVAEPVQNALHNVKLAMEEALDNCKADKYKVYLTGKNNYREAAFPEYKANRDAAHKPVHYQSIKDYIVRRWHGAIVEGLEADDAIGISGYEHDAIMASIDKDLLMVPGTHYHLRDKTFKVVDDEEGDLIFLRQWLTGDSTDNIPGIKGTGPAKAKKLIPDGMSKEEGYWTVLNTYPSREDAYLNGSLVWILRNRLEKRNIETVMNQVKAHLLS